MFAVTPGVRKRYRRSVNCASDALFLFIDGTILASIKKHTECSEFKFSLDELKAFIGLQCARGLYGKHHSVEFLWGETFGSNLFRRTMTRKRFSEFKKHLRFDDKMTRRERKIADPFACIRSVFDAFTANCRAIYKPHYSLSIDEQLMPLKNRTRLRTYMPNKPDKYGIKFWMLADNESKYVYNVIPYLGASEKQSRNGRTLAEDVVCRLMDGLFDKGYNITTDNFFTSPRLADVLKKRNTTMVGTVRPYRTGLPRNAASEMLSVHDSVFYWNTSTEQLLVNYQSKKQKSVHVLSTMHRSCRVQPFGKRKPNVILFYNKNKCGVDVVDNMLKMYSSRCASRRWPMAVWQNVLDIAVLNAWICYQELLNVPIKRIQFIMQLVEELCTNKFQSIQRISLPSPTYRCRKRQKCTNVGCRNRTNSICRFCQKHFCGPCSAESSMKVTLIVCKQCELAE